MTQNLNQEFVHLELGDYLELLQNTILIGGKRLNDKEICRKISMSPPDLWQGKKGESLKLSQYYSVFRIYREELKNRPEELYNVLTELGLRLEADYLRLHVPRP